MGQKIRGRAGESLGGLYDLPGGSTEIGELEAGEIHTVHEMGDTLLSERLMGFTSRTSSGDIAQNTAFGANVSGQVVGISRVVGISAMVLAADAGSVANAQVSVVAGPTASRSEIPIWVWDVTDDVESPILWEDGALPPAAWVMLRPALGPNLPFTMIGPHARLHTASMVFRGTMGAFGAGTVEIILQTHVLVPDDRQGLATVGLPVPSW